MFARVFSAGRKIYINSPIYTKIRDCFKCFVPHYTSPMIQFSRFFIVGNEEHAVHGGRHRREIKKIADKLKVYGSVRNIKNKPQIEIRYSEKKNAQDFLGEVLDYATELKLQISTPSSFDEDDEEDYKPFKVIREDELTEMVWALQGAGDVFTQQLQQKKSNCFRSVQSIMGYVGEDKAGQYETREPLRKCHREILQGILIEPPFDPGMTNWLFLLLRKMATDDWDGAREMVKNFEEGKGAEDGDKRKLYELLKKRGET